MELKNITENVLVANSEVILERLCCEPEEVEIY